MSREIPRTDAIVVGSGPNGMAAAIELAREGLSVVVVEAKETLGGAVRTAELTLPGFLHDVCSAIHPLALGSAFFAKLQLEKHGLQWIHPLAPLAHPFDNGTAAVLHRSVAKTALTLGRDGERYMKFMSPLAKRWPYLSHDILGPMHAPRHPLNLALFARLALRSAIEVSASTFRDEYARGLFAGLSAHSFLPLERRGSAAFGMVLGMLGHVVGWPFPKRGAQEIINSMVSYFRTVGGHTAPGTPVNSLDDLPRAKLVLLDVTPRQVLTIAGKRLPWLYREQLKRYQYGPGVFKVDWALDGPIPWKAEECKLAGTVHLGGTMEEIAAAESEVASGKHPARPFVLVAQQSLFDRTRAPAQKHTGWAYCHVPHGSSFEMTERIEEQIERFAPGFRRRILARRTRAASEFEAYNSNCIGGDITGGLQNLRQIIARPALKLNPYSTPLRGIYLCSSSTPPGGGVHGLCGYYAARSALKARLS